MSGNCAGLPNSKHLEETDVRILQRVAFELYGYNTLIREFTVTDTQFNLDQDKWEDLLRRRDRLIDLQQELLTKLCGPGYSGRYSMDFSTGELCWG
ncbi:MAG: hypothetical protein RSD95_09860 [Clostridia bacterium]